MILLIRAILYVAVVCPILLPAYAYGNTACTLPDTAMLNEFSKQYGPGSFTTTDVPGPGVRFDFTGLGAGGTGIGDNYLVAGVYGQILPSHGNGDFSNFDSYAVSFANLNSSGTVDISLIMNTGFTGPSGNPPNNPANDTFWQSDWIAVPAGEAITIVLDFDNAIAYNITDNPVPHTEGGNGSPDGSYYSINATDRTEFSNIGFQVADSSGGSASASLFVGPPIKAPLLEPDLLVLVSILLLAIGATLLTAGFKKVPA